MLKSVVTTCFFKKSYKNIRTKIMDTPKGVSIIFILQRGLESPA